MLLLLIVSIMFIIIFFIQFSYFNTIKADSITYPHGPVGPSNISLSSEGDIDLSLVSSPIGDNIVIEPNETTISTNNAEGYELTINTDSTDNKLSHLAPELDSFFIDSISPNNSPLEFSSWGYTTNNPNGGSNTPSTAGFNSVPTGNDTSAIISSSQVPNDTGTIVTPDVATVYYGAKVAFNDLPAGYYSNTIVYTALPNIVIPPTIGNINPNSGGLDGGETIVITGTSFDSIVNIKIGDNDCNDISITSATTVECTTPASTSGYGPVDVVIINQGGSITQNNGFSYINTNPPNILSITPNSGTGLGGTEVTIVGTDFGEYKAPTNINYDTCGKPQNFIVLSSDTYRLEVWGAQGGQGTSAAYPGGKGGYSTGEVNLNAGDRLYVYVGCAGATRGVAGWNGGGAAWTVTDNYAGGGGGATDIRLIQDNDPSDLTSLQSRIIVAGGGGGKDRRNGTQYFGGIGGGLNGGSSGINGTTYTAATGGTQNSGGTGGYYNSSQAVTTGGNGSFGIGGNANTTSSSYYGGGGGGGWYGGGGGATFTYSTGGGGGSGYVFTSTSDKTGHSSNIPDSRFYLSNASTVDGGVTNGIPDPTDILGTTNVTGWEGNGYARISTPNFTGAISSVYIGDVECVVSSWSDTSITCATSARLAENVDVVVTSSNGKSDNLAGGFTYTEPQATYCGTYDYECIIFSVNVTNNTYSIPTSGRVANMNHEYDWMIYVDDNLVTSTMNNTDCNAGSTSGISGNCTGTSGTAIPGANGIILNNLTNGTHEIKIIPHHDNTLYSTSGSIPGWGNAFGHQGPNTGTANSTDNKSKLISINQPITTLAFAPKTSESTTNASYMFANLFYSCANLTTVMQIKNTYTLPDTITNLSNFFAYTHYANTNLQSAIDLEPFRDWFFGNKKITDLNYFFAYTHRDNSSTSFISPIDLEPLTNWFSANNTITNLTSFLAAIHFGNSNLQSAIDLEPLRDWFFENEKIANLDNFLYYTHYYNNHSNFQSSIDLGPLTNWFRSNNTITSLSYFLYGTHYYNSSLQSAIDLEPISGWFFENEKITNLSTFLSNTHFYCSNTSFISPIDLEPLENWFSANSSITDLSRFLSNIHNGGTNLQSAIDLEPISGWFFENQKITNLTNFLEYSHRNNSSASFISPIDLEPLENWFSANNTITNLSYFLYYTHANNYTLQSAIDLEPISGWFFENQKINNLTGFLSETHLSNSGTSFISPIDLEPLENWFSANDTITNLSSFLHYTHNGNSYLQSAINLEPLRGWFFENERITNLSRFLNNTHAANNSVNFTSPVDLEPLENWFSANDSITNLSYFLSATHYNCSRLLSPIDVTALSGWFAPGREMSVQNSLEGFMRQTHYNNNSITLNGQIVLPSWIMTMKYTYSGANTSIWNTGTSTNTYSFYQTFRYNGTKNDDIGEVRFDDAGNSVLSSVGVPTVGNLQTYVNRTVFSGLTNWY